MELRTAASPRDVKHYTTERLREEFLIDDLFQPDVIKLVYSHIDRIITGSAVPVKETLKLTAGDELRAQYFCERRELGVINIGGARRGHDRRKGIQCCPQRRHVHRHGFKGHFLCQAKMQMLLQNFT